MNDGEIEFLPLLLLKQQAAIKICNSVQTVFLRVTVASILMKCKSEHLMSDFIICITAHTD
jgi:hypothetical protein